MSVSPAKRRGRPPRLPRATGDTRALLIRRGLETLTERGYVAMGLDGVLRGVGVPKGSFYHYFDSKEAFCHAVLDAYAAYFADKLDRHLLDDRQPPLARLAAFVEDACAGMARHAFRRGCLVGNLGQDASALPQAFAARLDAILSDWSARLAACLRAAQNAGELDTSADCDALAEFFWIGWEGAVLRARIAASDAPMRLFHRGYAALLSRGGAALA